MGSVNGNSNEKKVHQVTVDSFLIGKYPVTQELWQSVMGTNPSNLKGAKRPVESVNWFDAVDFCNRFSEMDGWQKVYSRRGEHLEFNLKATGYRLPTEAEWEFASRGGLMSKNFLFSGSNAIDEVAWYWGNSGNMTHEVGTKQCNEIGICDMSGNVWEWCWDWFSDSSYNSETQLNPTGPKTGTNHVLRGGSWSSGAWGCTVTNRYSDNAISRFYRFGFRLVRTR